jgi:anti-sigma factor RsiW
MEDTCTMAPRVGAFHDGELEGEARTLVEEHLATCATCQTELASLRRMSALFDQAPVAALGAKEVREVRNRAEAMVADPLPLGFIGGLLAAAASIVIVCGAWWGELPSPAGTSPSAPLAFRQMEPWEQVALSPWRTRFEFREDGTAVAAADEQLADWMLSGLSGGGGEGLH